MEGVRNHPMKRCTDCAQEKSAESFSKSQWKGKATTRKCISCIFEAFKNRTKEQSDQQKLALKEKDRVILEIKVSKKEIQKNLEKVKMQNGKLVETYDAMCDVLNGRYTEKELIEERFSLKQEISRCF